jgi:hypothetical protein
MRSRLEWVLIAITALIGYLFQSAGLKKLLFFENVFSDDFHSAVFDHSLLILTVLAFCYIIIRLVIYRRDNSKSIIFQCNNMCRYIYKQVEKATDNSFIHHVRVTIFRAVKSDTDSTYIKAISRYQTRSPNKKTRLKFRPGEGCAGMCFESQTLIYKVIPEYMPYKPQKYYENSYKTFNLDQIQVKKLNIKSCMFLGIPIKCFETEKTWGVLMIDSTKHHNDFDRIARELESIVSHYSAFFIEGDMK